jgi:hypothetical protein
MLPSGWVQEDSCHWGGSVKTVLLSGLPCTTVWQIGTATQLWRWVFVESEPNVRSLFTTSKTVACWHSYTRLHVGVTLPTATKGNHLIHHQGDHPSTLHTSETCALDA